MATKFYTFKGKVAWAKVHEPDEYLGVKKWKVNFFPENEAEFKSTGVQLRAKNNTNSNNNVPIGTFYALSRPVSKTFGDKVEQFEPPVVFDNEGNKYDGIIGNGSVVEVRISVYDTRMGKGHRLEGIKVLELVELEPLESKEDSASSETKPW